VLGLLGLLVGLKPQAYFGRVAATTPCLTAANVVFVFFVAVVGSRRRCCGSVIVVESHCRCFVAVGCKVESCHFETGT
jgi:hypothetical protein